MKKYQKLSTLFKKPEFKALVEDSTIRIRFGVEVYEMRIARGMTQQRLAREASTTQKVISQIESGDVNVGLVLASRIANALTFRERNFANIFRFQVMSSAVVTAEIKEDIPQLNQEFFPVLIQRNLPRDLSEATLQWNL